MDWLNTVKSRAQQAVNTVVNSETAGLARQLAQQASQQAAALAKEATVKAQEVAKEAYGEAEKSIQNFRQGKKTVDDLSPVQLGITPELEQFVRSLTYSTFSDWPLDTLDIPHDPAQQRLSRWQERHARLILQKVPQLQDLRFVLSPKRMDEYTFWMIYFTLCKRYLPTEEDQLLHSQHSAVLVGLGVSSGNALQQADSKPSSSSSEQHRQPADAQDTDSTATASVNSRTSAASGDAAAPAATSTHAEVSRAADEGDVDDAAVDEDLPSDPELDAYLQDALQLHEDGGDGGEAAGDEQEGDHSDTSDIGDIDDYINKLDAEVGVT